MDAPTPPEPPTTATRRESRSSVASTPVSHATPCGSGITSAPSGMDHVPSSAASNPTRWTCLRAGGPDDATAAARSPPTSTTRADAQRCRAPSAVAIVDTGSPRAAAVDSTASRTRASAVTSTTSPSESMP